ncbi:hypothetical protein AMAG_09465 [Allomyces macrogynus ATCC 38327]|uniref:MADS-box domain-containing protein n=1 Tax=Allomyces macrogynus (strain ATCC 38327) TaxID=578462 RepID=A0A0L0SPK9_ALLM3|nr:hypothetical protein AMAG_09465 [Allomyces macrogynus ATCC 38327]|eukprot:KNE64443.1 hypothetical protein AMAG_09465 [Allomyces macrogynus ATCC 38327]
MGRKKVRIQPIADARPRQVTFIKRKTGLLKKCFELSTLCSCDVAVLIFSATGKLTEYASNGDLDSVLLRYTEYTKPHEIKSNQDFLDDGAADKSKSSAKSIRNDDDDDEAGGDSDHDGAAVSAAGPSGTANAGPAVTPLLAPNPQSIMPAPGTSGVMHHVGHHPQAGPYPIQLQPQQQPQPPPPPTAQYQQQPFQTHGAFYGHVPQPQQQQPQAPPYGGGQDMTGPFHAFGAAPVQHHPHQHHQQQHFQGTPMQHSQQPFGPPMFPNDATAAAAMYGATTGQVSVPPQLSYTVDPATGYVTAVDPAAAARGNANDQYATYQAGGMFHPQQQQQQHPQPFPMQPQQQQHPYAVQSHAYAQPHPTQQHHPQQQGYLMQQMPHAQQQQQQQPLQPAVFSSGAPTQLAPAAEPTTGFLSYDQVPPPSSSGPMGLTNPLTQATQIVAPSPASTAAAAGSPALTAAIGSPAMTARAGSASVAPSPLVVGQKRARGDESEVDRESTSPQSAKRKPHFARRAPFSLKVHIPGTAAGEGDTAAGAGAAVAPLTLEPNPNTPTTWSPSLPPPPPPMRSGSTGSNGSGTGAATTTTTTTASRAPPAIAVRPSSSVAASRPGDPALPASAFPPSLPSPYPAASTVVPRRCTGIQRVRAPATISVGDRAGSVVGAVAAQYRGGTAVAIGVCAGPPRVALARRRQLARVARVPVAAGGCADAGDFGVGGSECDGARGYAGKSI